MIRFRLEIVGGPYDGVRGLVMAVMDEPLPGWIWLGLCRGDGGCAIPECPGARHPAFWLPEENGDQPPSAMRYELRDQDDVRRVGTYAVGGVRPVQTAVAGDEVPMVEQENPLVPAGSYKGVPLFAAAVDLDTRVGNCPCRLMSLEEMRRCGLLS